MNSLVSLEPLDPTIVCSRANHTPSPIRPSLDTLAAGRIKLGRLLTTGAMDVCRKGR